MGRKSDRTVKQQANLQVTVTVKGEVLYFLARSSKYKNKIGPRFIWMNAKNTLLTLCVQFYTLKASMNLLLPRKR